MPEPENPRAVIGGNLPPEEARVNDLVATANRWLAERPELTDQDMADKCGAFIDQINAEAKALEKKRRAEKKPHEDAAAAVDARFKPMAALLEKAKSMLQPKLTAWLQKLRAQQAEAARLAREEALRLEAEAQRAAAEAAKAADVVGASVEADAALAAAAEAAKAARRAETAQVNMKSNIGGRTKSLRTVWKARLTDPAKAVWALHKHPEMIATAERIASAIARAEAAKNGGTSTIPGVEFYPEQTAA